MNDGHRTVMVATSAFGLGIDKRRHPLRDALPVAGVARAVRAGGRARRARRVARRTASCSTTAAIARSTSCCSRAAACVPISSTSSAPRSRRGRRRGANRTCRRSRSPPSSGPRIASALLTKLEEGGLVRMGRRPDPTRRRAGDTRAGRARARRAVRDAAPTGRAPPRLARRVRRPDECRASSCAATSANPTRTPCGSATSVAAAGTSRGLLRPAGATGPAAHAARRRSQSARREARAEAAASGASRARACVPSSRRRSAGVPVDPTPPAPAVAAADASVAESERGAAPPPPRPTRRTSAHGRRRRAGRRAATGGSHRVIERRRPAASPLRMRSGDRLGDPAAVGPRGRTRRRRRAAPGRDRRAGARRDEFLAARLAGDVHFLRAVPVVVVRLGDDAQIDEIGVPVGEGEQTAFDGLALFDFDSRPCCASGSPRIPPLLDAGRIGAIRMGSARGPRSAAPASRGSRARIRSGSGGRSARAGATLRAEALRRRTRRPSVEQLLGRADRVGRAARRSRRPAPSAAARGSSATRVARPSARPPSRRRRGR